VARISNARSAWSAEEESEGIAEIISARRFRERSILLPRRYNPVVVGGTRKTLWILAGVVVVAGLVVSAYRFTGRHSDSRQEPHSVTLTWNPAANAISYNVYRSQISGGPYEKIGTVTAPAYRDKPVPSGAVLYYVVTTVSKTGESRYSQEMKAVIP
jgi:hypothetical protein